MNEEIDKTKLVKLDNEKKRTKLRDICISSNSYCNIYIINSVVLNLHQAKNLCHFKFILYYGIEMMILGVYAIIWQQLMKKFDISVAYANKAMGLLMVNCMGNFNL